MHRAKQIKKAPGKMKDSTYRCLLAFVLGFDTACGGASFTAMSAPQASSKPSRGANPLRRRDWWRRGDLRIYPRSFQDSKETVEIEWDTARLDYLKDLGVERSADNLLPSSGGFGSDSRIRNIDPQYGTLRIRSPGGGAESAYPHLMHGVTHSTKPSGLK